MSITFLNSNQKEDLKLTAQVVRKNSKGCFKIRQKPILTKKSVGVGVLIGSACTTCLEICLEICPKICPKICPEPQGQTCVKICRAIVVYFH